MTKRPSDKPLSLDVEMFLHDRLGQSLDDSGLAGSLMKACNDVLDDLHAACMGQVVVTKQLLWSCCASGPMEPVPVSGPVRARLVPEADDAGPCCEDDTCECDQPDAWRVVVLDTDKVKTKGLRQAAEGWLEDPAYGSREDRIDFHVLAPSLEMVLGYEEPDWASHGKAPRKPAPKGTKKPAKKAAPKKPAPKKPAKKALKKPAKKR
jgi:hypothetical protein